MHVHISTALLKCEIQLNSWSSEKIHLFFYNPRATAANFYLSSAELRDIMRENL